MTFKKCCFARTVYAYPNEGRRLYTSYHTFIFQRESNSSEWQVRHKVRVETRKDMMVNKHGITVRETSNKM